MAGTALVFTRGELPTRVCPVPCSLISNTKVPEYQTTTVHLTTHRLILVPEGDASSKCPPSLQLQLRHVRQTEFYNGFMRSSAKITLSLGPQAGQAPPVATNSSNGSGSRGGGGSWTCAVCAYVNSLPETQTEPRPQSRCGLCGVAYEKSKTMGVSARPSAPSTPIPSALATQPAGTENGGSMVACPACTFLNHPSLPSCEICSTPLPRRRPQPQAAVPQSTPTHNNDARPAVARLSFRQGGEKEAYRRLKNVLSDRAWERAAGPSSSAKQSPDTPRAGAGIGELANDAAANPRRYPTDNVA